MRVTRDAAALILLGIWAVAALIGARQLLAPLPGQLRSARMSEAARRAATWPAIYGFARACAPALAPGPGATLTLLDPTGLPPFGEAYGIAYDVDQADLNAFMYATYPRAVTPTGHIPAGGTAGLPATDYLALWEWGSGGYRSPGTVAAARAAEGMLRAELPGRPACAYAGAGGDRGVVFALSPAARRALAQSPTGGATGRTDQATGAAAPPPLPSVRGSGPAYVLALLGLASLWVIGALALRLIAGRALSTLLAAALALPLGGLAAGLELLLFSLLAIPWSASWLALPWLLLAGAAAWSVKSRWIPLGPPAASRQTAATGAGAITNVRARKGVPAGSRRSQDFAQTLGAAGPRLTGRGLAADERVALVLLAVVAAAVTVVAPVGLPGSDGFSRYYFKAHAFYVDHSATPYYAQAAGRAARPLADLLFSLPAHPPLTSLDVTWLYLWIGGENEHASLLLWPALLLSLLAAFYALARGALSRRAALWSTLALALIGTDLSGSAANGGFTDMPLAAYLLMGCGLLWSWASSSQPQPAGASPRPLLVAGLLLGAAALTKQEGLTAALIALAATPLLALRRVRGEPSRPRPAWWVPLAWALPAAALAYLPWALLRLRYPLPDPNIYTGWGLATMLRNAVVAAAGVGARTVPRWYAVYALIAAWALLSRRAGLIGLLARASGRAWFLAAVVAGQLAIDVAGIVVSPIPVRFEVPWAANRLLDQLFPLLLLGAVALWPRVLAPYTEERGAVTARDGEPSLIEPDDGSKREECSLY